MGELDKEESRWYYRNPEKAKFMYVGKEQQDQMVKLFDSACYMNCKEKPIGKITSWMGYKVVYVDEDSYLRLGN